MKPIRLQLNHRNNPLGIDDKQLRLTWNVEGGITQSAYQVTVKNENETVFDSGKISSSSMNCTAAFEPESRTRYFWSVTVWDENGVSEKSETAFFETGISPEEWRAGWITSGLMADEERLPADYSKKEFSLSRAERLSLQVRAIIHLTEKLSPNGKRKTAKPYLSLKSLQTQRLI